MADGGQLHGMHFGSPSSHTISLTSPTDPLSLPINVSVHFIERMAALAACLSGVLRRWPPSRRHIRPDSLQLHMVRIHAPTMRARVAEIATRIAVMTQMVNGHAPWDGTIGECPRHPMRPTTLAIQPELAITVIETVCGPQPAVSVRSDLNVEPEPFRRRHSRRQRAGTRPLPVVRVAQTSPVWDQPTPRVNTRAACHSQTLLHPTILTCGGV